MGGSKSMSEVDKLHGLACPRCGGVISLPEGHVIVRCPYCDLRSFVRGERGLRRYQVPRSIEKQAAEGSMRNFLSRMQITRDCAKKAQLTEAFLAYVPFWVMWTKVFGWAFGQKRVGSGEHKRYEPREVRLMEDMSWNGAACDVGEFGVDNVPLSTGTLEPFQPDLLHEQGMVFEPVNSAVEAEKAAEESIQKNFQRRARLDRISQLFVRFFNKRFGLVYYPLWVLRYLYRDRAFQVVVDGRSGDVLYGKAPGNTFYRAAILVGGMALGAFLVIDLSSLVLFNGSDDSAGFGLVLLGVGLGIMFAAYRVFRYGEQYEYRSGKKLTQMVEQPLEMLGNVKDLERWIDALN